MDRTGTASSAVDSRGIIRHAAIEALEGRRLFTAANPSVVDLYIGYTASALADVGGSVGKMNDKINREVALVNLTMANSKVAVSVRVVGVMLTSYVETGVSKTDIDRLQKPGDGFADDLSNAAIAAGADVTTLIQSKMDAGGIAGGNANVLKMIYLSTGILSHELGHNLGGGHPHGPGETSINPAAYEGKLNFNGHTVYGPIGGGLPYYSNPNVSFYGQPTGIGGSGPTAANNALVMNRNAAEVAATRATTVTDNAGPNVALGSLYVPNAAGSGLTNPLPRNGWTVTASSAADPVANMTDGNLGTRWTTGTPMANGQFIQIDLGAQQTFSSLSLDTGPGSTNDFPRGYAVYVSNNGTDWATQAAVATGQGTSQVTSITFKEVNARFVRVVQTGSHPEWWWSVAELNIGTAAPAASNTIKFQVIYTDGSGVSVPSFGDDDVVVNGPNGFAGNATLVQIDDASTNFAYHVVTYQFTTPGPVGPLGNYTFNMRAGGVTDTLGNAASAGKIGGPTPLMPDYAGDDPAGPITPSAEVGDLTGQTWQITDEIGPYYRNAYFDPASYHFSLSKDTTLTVNLPAKTTAGGDLAAIVFQDKNNNLQNDGGDESVAPTTPNVFNLKAGSNYYLALNPWQSGGIPFGQFTMTVSASGTPAPSAAPATLSGKMYSDENKNGVQDNGEAGLKLAAVKLTGTDATGNAVARWAYTDADGVYAFTNLQPSSPAGYTITELPVYEVNTPTGQGTNTVGNLGGTTSGNDAISGIVVSAGANGTGYTFAILPLAKLTKTTLSGQAYIDANKSGTKEPEEQAIAGATLTLTGSDARGASVKLTAVTDTNGVYTITDVPPSDPKQVAGGYSIVYTQPANTGTSYPELGSLGALGTRTNEIIGVPVTDVAGTGYDWRVTALAGGAPPVAAGVTVTTDQNTGATGTVVTTPAAAARAIAAAPIVTYAQLVPNTGPSHAKSFSFKTDGTFKYEPQYNFFGTDSFQYQLINDNGTSTIATVTIKVTQVNQPPEIRIETPQALLTDQATSLDFDLNPLVEDIDSATIKFVIGKVTGGKAALQKDGHTVRFTPNATFDGIAKIEFTANDGRLTSKLALEVCVCKVNYPPVMKNDSTETKPSTAVEFNPTANDYTVDKELLSLVSVGKPANGTASIDTNGSTDPSKYRLVYTPNFGFHGTDSFVYTIHDLQGQTASAKAYVTVKPGAGLGKDPFHAGKTAVDVYGTTGADTITLTDVNGGVNVKMNGILLGSYKPNGVLGVFGNDGNDTVDARGTTRTVVLFGEGGDDRLWASSAPSILVGGSGKDVLYGGKSGDLLISGPVDHGKKGFAPLANAFSGNTSLTGYALEDNAADRLYGGDGKDKFWANITGRGAFDTVYDRKSDELLADLV